MSILYSSFLEITWKQACTNPYQAVTSALKAGYRHIDAAAVYENEVEVGEGIKASGVERKDIFVSRQQSSLIPIL